jgi:hypothetical protein
LTEWLGKLTRQLSVLCSLLKLRPPGAPSDRSSALDILDNRIDHAIQADYQDQRWDRAAAVRMLVERTQDLRALYGNIGYFPEVDRACTQLLQELKGLIRAEITDFAAFQGALKGARDRLLQEEGGHRKPAAAGHSLSNAVGGGHDDLLQAILQAGDNNREVLTLLNRDPVYESLPFIERLPFIKGGKVIWRTPMQHAIIRKRPLDMTCFVQRLSELETLVHASPIRRQEQSWQEVLDAIARVRRYLSQEDAYIPTSLLTLERKIVGCVQRPPSAKGRARLEQLEGLLGELLAIRRRCRLDGTADRRVNRSDFDSCKATLLHAAKSYLETPWMQIPWLTTFILTTLLEAELATLPETLTTGRAILTSGLRLIHEEVASGRYDRDETVRRLRQLEATGLYVHSFIYALLRLNKPRSSLKATTSSTSSTLDLSCFIC